MSPGLSRDRLRLFHLREFAVHPGRTLASVVVMAVSAAFLVAVLGITGSLTGSVTRLVSGLAGNAALEVSGITDSGFPQSITADVAAVPGVAAAVPMLQTQAATAAGPVLLLGADARAVALDSSVKQAVLDQFGALLAVPDGVLVGPGLGHRPGDVFRIGAGTATVAGVLHGGALARLNDGHYVLAPLPVAQRLAGRVGQLDSVLVIPAPGERHDALRHAVTAAVHGRAVVGAPSLRAAQTGNGVRILQYMTLMGATTAFVVAAFLIYTATGMAITQRRPVLSMLRAIGARQRTLATDILAESAILGLVGGAIGALLGIGMGRAAIGGLPAVFLQSVQARMQYLLPAYAIPVAILAAVATSVAAAAVAVRQVYSVSPIEALAPVGVSRADRVPAWLRTLAALAAVTACGLAVAIVALRTGVLAFSAAALALFFGSGMVLCFACGDRVVAAVAAAARRLGPAGALAAATVERAPRRVWATTMTVTIAVAMTVTITGANNDMLTSARASLAAVGDADVWAASHPADEFPIGPVLPGDLAARIGALPDVARVTEGQLAFAALGDTKVLLYGLAPDSDTPLYRAMDPAGRHAVTAGDGIVVSRDLAATLHARLGDHLTVQTPSGPRAVAVRAVVPYFSVLTGAVGISLDHMRAWYQRPGATVLQIDAKPGVDHAALRDRIRALAPPDVHVYTGADALAGISSAANEGMAVANAVWIIVVVIAAVALLNTLTLSVLERRRELGVLRAIGSSRRFTVRMIVAEGLGLGVVGGALGLALGLAAQYFYDRVTPDMMHFDVDYRPGLVILAFAAGALAVTLIGMLPPAVRAARLNIVQAVGIE